jgi:glycosyltransferase involved in cell wall biosynthesis
LKRKWFCSQIGAREHYAVPRILHRDGRLATLYTDFWAGSFVRGMSRMTTAKFLRSLATRFHSDLADAAVVSWIFRSLVWESGTRRQERNRLYENFSEIGQAFAICVREALKHRKDFDSDSIFFSYDTGALETMEWCRERGARCILNQMDPSRVEVELVQQEEKLWPGWAPQTIEVPEEYFKRREKEWALADCVVVNSDFCRQALVKQGVLPEKLRVVPLCFEKNSKSATPNREIQREAKEKLRVLFLGQVILRKGIQYLIETAKLLQNENVQFNVVGPIGISEAAIAAAPKNIVFHGRVTRDQAANWYRQSDVFVLPTLSDGFAITQLEAMSYGLPVVATSSCGAVVSDGVDGFIVLPRDAAALAKSLQKYLKDHDLLEQQSHAALIKIQQFDMEHLAENLWSLEDNR